MHGAYGRHDGITRTSYMKVSNVDRRLCIFIIVRLRQYKRRSTNLSNAVPVNRQRHSMSLASCPAAQDYCRP
jgi:hypothetical protein